MTFSIASRRRAEIAYSLIVHRLERARCACEATGLRIDHKEIVVEEIARAIEETE